MTAVPFKLRLLMIEVGAATPFYQQPPQFPRVAPEVEHDAPRPSTASVVAA